MEEILALVCQWDIAMLHCTTQNMMGTASL